MILSPFTDWILHYLPIGPFWILELAELFVVVGLILALTDKATTIGLITAITRALTGNNKNFSIGVSPGYARRAGLVLMIAGLSLSAAAIDGIASTPSFATYLSTGGPSLYHCPDVFTLVCWNGSTNSNATSVCQQTFSSPCLTQVQSGSADCTIGTISTNCILASINFAKAYASVPTYNQTLFYGSSGKVPVFSTTTTLGATSFITYNRLIFQAVNSTTWTNMTSHDNPVELYGLKNQELITNLPAAATSVQAELCVDVVDPSQNATATLGVQFGTTDIADGNGNILANVGNSVGLQCSSPFGNTNIPVATVSTFRIVGRDGASNFICSPSCATNPICASKNVALGFGTNVDCPRFGTIELLYWYTLTLSNTAPNPCLAYTFALTVSSIRPAVRCNSVPSVGVTFHLSWTVGVLA